MQINCLKNGSASTSIPKIEYGWFVPNLHMNSTEIRIIMSFIAITSRKQ